MKTKAYPSQSELRELFDYDEKRGILVRRISRTRRVRVGDDAGSIHDPKNGKPPRRVVRVMPYGSCKHSILVYIWHHGEIGGVQIDHKDGNTLNDRIANLRPTSSSQNSMNRRLRQDKALPKGVSWHKRQQKFVARVKIDGQLEWLGTFDTAEEAKEAYEARAKELHKEYYHPG